MIGSRSIHMPPWNSKVGRGNERQRRRWRRRRDNVKPSPQILIELVDVLVESVVVVEARDVVDTNRVEDGMLRLLSPVDVLRNPHLAIDVKAFWARPTAYELDDRVRALRRFERARQPDAKRVPRVRSGHLTAIECRQDLPQLTVQHIISEGRTVDITEERRCAVVLAEARMPYGLFDMADFGEGGWGH